MSRIQLLEAPYLEEYINWYLQLGFNRVYFLNTEPHNESIIKTFITPQSLTKVTFVNHICQTNSFTYLRKMFTDIATEDYILHADSDEYFMLPKKYQNIGELIKAHPAEKYYFRWVNIPIDSLFEKSITEYIHSAKATARFCATHKMMVKRQVWLDDPAAKCEPHSFGCKGTQHVFSDPESTGEIPFYIHILIRGYLHTALKVLEQRLPTIRGKTPKNVLKDFLNKQLPLRQYPFRFLSASGEYCACTRDYLASRLDNWNIPTFHQLLTDHSVKTVALYISILKKYAVNTNSNILVEDIFNLEKKISQCNATVMSKNYHKQFVNKTPEWIGKYIQNNI